MMTKADSRTYWRVVASATPRTLLILSAFLLPLVIGTLVAKHTTLAGNTVGSFEIDGNLIVDHLVPPTEPIDWDSSPFPAALATFTDGTGPTDDIFGMGTKENDQSTWVCTTGSAPPKDDLVNEISLNGAPPIAGQIALRFFPVSGAQKQFLYANWSRLSNNGDAHIDTGLTATGTNLFGELALNISDTIGTIPCNKVLFASM